MHEVNARVTKVKANMCIGISNTCKREIGIFVAVKIIN